MISSQRRARLRCVSFVSIFGNARSTTCRSNLSFTAHSGGFLPRIALPECGLPPMLHPRMNPSLPSNRRRSCSNSSGLGLLTSPHHRLPISPRADACVLRAICRLEACCRSSAATCRLFGVARITPRAPAVFVERLMAEHHFLDWGNGFGHVAGTMVYGSQRTNPIGR